MPGATRTGSSAFLGGNIIHFLSQTSSRVILHLQEHLLDVGQAQLFVSRTQIFPKPLQLTRRYSIRFDGISLREERAEVFKETAGDFRRQFYWFEHKAKTVLMDTKSGFLEAI
jgi:hypothetical protein